jgi:hypothetical protein
LRRLCSVSAFSSADCALSSQTGGLHTLIAGHRQTLGNIPIICGLKSTRDIKFPAIRPLHG